MKYTKKWIVVPYNSITENSPKTQITTVLNDKSLSNEEKLTSYNNYKIRELRKKEIEKPTTEVNPTQDYFENISQNDHQIIDLNEEEKPKKIKSKKPKTLKDKSFFNVPPSKNTRTHRRIGDNTLNQAINSSIHIKKKTKKKNPTHEAIIEIENQIDSNPTEKTPENRILLSSK